MKRWKWKTVLALVVLYVGILLEWSWIWGLLFLFWTVPAFYAKRVLFVEEIERAENPVLYWTILVTWIVLSVYLIYEDIAKVLFPEVFS